MTFLELCQAVARESGTMSGTTPSSVVSQTGRQLKVVNWVIDAWRDIQNRRPDWRFLIAEFTGSVISGTGAYTGSGSFALSRFANFLTTRDQRRGDEQMTIYLTSSGVSDEMPLPFMPYPTFRRLYRRGTQTNDRPLYYSVDYSNQFVLGPVPNATFTVGGLYRKTPQVLAANADEPECRAAHHITIQWLALARLHEADGAWNAAAIAKSNYLQSLAALESAQLDRPEIVNEPLA